MRIRRAGRSIRACGKHTKGKRTSRRVFAAECVDEPVPQHGTSIARMTQRTEGTAVSHTVTVALVCASENTRVCVSEQSAECKQVPGVPVRTPACVVYSTKAKGRARASPSQSLVGASRIAHCLFPTRASIGHTQLPRENDVPHDTLRRYLILPHAGGGDLLTKVVATTEIFPPPTGAEGGISYGQTP